MAGKLDVSIADAKLLKLVQRVNLRPTYKIVQQDHSQID